MTRQHSTRELNLRSGIEFGRWKLVKYIGKGGNGIVWQAEDKTGKEGAIKFLLPKFYGDDRYVRFKHEADIHRKCDDVKGVLPLLDCNLPNIPTTKNPAWLVSSLATSITESLVNTGLREVIEAMLAISQTLSVLHDRGVSHRDIKPDNLFRFGNAWALGDFGLADFPDKDTVTKEGAKLGPAYYIAPEMLNDPTNADGKSADVYSLAKTLWVLATGQKYPLPGEQRIDEPALQLSSYRMEKKAKELDVLLEDATRTNPNKRPSMGFFAKELDVWLQGPPPIEHGGDISDLRGRVSAVVGKSVRLRERRETLISEAKSLLEESQVYFKPIESDVCDLGFRVSSSTWQRANGTNDTILRVCKSDQRLDLDKSFWSSGEAFVIEAEAQRTTFWCGIGVEISHDELFNVAMGYAIRSATENTARSLWTDNVQFIRGSPSEKSLMVELANRLRLNLRPSIERFLEITEKSDEGSS